MGARTYQTKIGPEPNASRPRPYFNPSRPFQTWNPPRQEPMALDLAAQQERAARYGHSLGKLVKPGRAPGKAHEATPTAAPASAAQPIQRALEPAEGLLGEAEEEAALLQQIGQFNQALNEADEGQEGTHQKLARLDAVEHSLYQWFNAHVAEQDNPKRANMFRLMDQIQGEHHGLIRHTVDNNLPLWVHGDQTHEENQHTQQTWTRITQGHGNAVRFDETVPGYGDQIPEEHLEQLKTGTFSDIARLMSRPHGRRLVSSLVDNATDEKPLTLGLRPLHDMTSGQISPSASDQGDPRAAIRVTENPEGPPTFQPGQGGRVRVNLVPGLKDSDYSDFNAANQRVPSPSFVGLGHELVHGAHYQQGTYAKPFDLHQIGPTFAALNAHYQGNLEEFATIASEEERAQQQAQSAVGSFYRTGEGEGGLDNLNQVNASLPMARLEEMNQNIPNEADIRAEHGIGLRSGHSTTVTPELHVDIPHELRGQPMTAEQTAQFVTRPAQIAQQLQQIVEPPLPPPQQEEHQPEPDPEPQPQNRRRGCFITTACVQAHGLPDDCEELTVLRQFRDSYMLGQPGGEELVELYYRVAPAIVRGIGRRSDAVEILEGLYAVVRQCVAAIQADRPEAAREVYTSMIMRLFEEYGDEEDLFGGEDGASGEDGEDGNVTGARPAGWQARS